MKIQLNNGAEVKSHGFYLAALTVAFEAMAREMLDLPSTRPFHFIDQIDNGSVRVITYSCDGGERFVSFQVKRPQFWRPRYTTASSYVFA
jgi:hypothetical protein